MPFYSSNCPFFALSHSPMILDYSLVTYKMEDCKMVLSGVLNLLLQNLSRKFNSGGLHRQWKGIWKKCSINVIYIYGETTNHYKSTLLRKWSGHDLKKPSFIYFMQTLDNLYDFF